MASLALHLKSSHHKPSQIILKSTSSNLTFSLLFSSSSSSDDNNNNNNGSGNPFSSFFDDIKSKLKHHEEQPQHQQSSGFRYPTTELNTQGPTNPKNAKSFDEIRKNLSEFRRRSTVPPPDFEQQQQQSTLFQSGNAGNPNANLGGKGGELSFSAIRDSLQKMRGTGGVGGSNTRGRMSLANYMNNLRLQQATPETGSGIGRGVGGLGVGIAGKVIGGSTENLPKSVFGKEMKEKEMKTGEARDGEDDESCFELFNMYTHDELGKKLKELRPEVKGKVGGKEENWFSISELGKRLKKLKEVEENQSSTVFSELRESLSSLNGKDNKPKNAPIQSFGLLSPSNFTEHPPQEHLVEKYFHPDNMSAEEKLKLELKKVRDEFKMHESDCGSTRVQIAQLTTEILHLSSVLHKKDKHSRRGLQAKVQQRKKLLKYLRRTDWESYCFVLSKLGLRDNPDYKN